MATLLHRVVEKALTGLLPPLRDLVNEYIGIIEIDLSLGNWRWLATQDRIEVCGFDVQKTHWGPINDQVIRIGKESPFLYLRGRDCNPPFSCQLTFDHPQSTENPLWKVQIDPDANKIISYDDITPSYRKSTPRPSYSSSS
jgi:hypothetical protein